MGFLFYTYNPASLNWRVTGFSECKTTVSTKTGSYYYYPVTATNFKKGSYDVKATINQCSPQKNVFRGGISC